MHLHKSPRIQESKNGKKRCEASPPSKRRIKEKGGTTLVFRPVQLASSTLVLHLLAFGFIDGLDPLPCHLESKDRCLLALK
mmetsp:Transcript_6920/g.26707  ORF Transcript_6920/g.26707 Transcript_6920/m.26707 type:complete len:81 (-) Transcript_6920:532-774(-)